ncbi:MAG: GlsB/YeaQ/YmgE family stress response membrane protein [Bulleidia sp.]|nr:GlsB/YeaQ/YmgE family stress response membrane protein [Bulleidia sp.]
MLLWLIRVLIVGLVAGWLSAKLMGMDSSSWVSNLCLGLVGSFVGGLVGRLLGLGATNILGSIILSVIGAFLAVWIYKKLKK